MVNGLASIIVLSYKKFDGLEENIKSIYMQDYPQIEIILSDDGSENFDYKKWSSLREEKGSNIVRFEILNNKENQGTVKNINLAIKASEGEIIIPLSADDRFYSVSTVSTIMREFKDANCMAISSKRLGEKSKKIYPNERESDMLKRCCFEELFEASMSGNPISGSVLYQRRLLWESMNGFDEKYRLLEDSPYIMKLLTNKIKVGFLDEVTIIYGEDGVSNRKNIERSGVSSESRRARVDFWKKNKTLIKSKKVEEHLRFIEYKERSIGNPILYYVGYLMHCKHTFRMIYANHLQKIKSDFNLYLDVLKDNKRI